MRLILCANMWIPVKPGADTERLLLRSGIGAIDCGRLLLWATPWLLRGQAATVSPRHIVWFMDNRKLTKEEGEDSVVVSSVKKRLRHRNIRKYYSLSRLSAVRNKELVKFIVQPSAILYLPLLYGGDSAVPVRKKDSNSYRIETM